MPKKLIFQWNGQNIELSLSDSHKELSLSYELAWRTEEDENFRRSQAWKSLRLVVLQRDNQRCNYCGYSTLKGMHVNHIDGNPKENSLSNLEVICPTCHMFLHSGLWCEVQKVIDCFAESNYTQIEIIQITRQLREASVPDNGIINFIGLQKPMPWKQDLKYLAQLYGFVTSRKPDWNNRKPLLTEEEQKFSLKNRNRW